jgi:hypothetical protein
MTNTFQRPHDCVHRILHWTAGGLLAVLANSFFDKLIFLVLAWLQKRPHLHSMLMMYTSQQSISQFDHELQREEEMTFESTLTTNKMRKPL